ncbi:MAG: hypothetical protein HC875_13790 [Anaerolineales bacterium]|nr:hypothetical protein [Anaerolineales bacterium]
MKSLPRSLAPLPPCFPSTPAGCSSGAACWGCSSCWSPCLSPALLSRRPALSSRVPAWPRTPLPMAASFGYQWPNFFKFFLMLTATGAVLRIVRCPICSPVII